MFFSGFRSEAVSTTINELRNNVDLIVTDRRHRNQKELKSWVEDSPDGPTLVFSVWGKQTHRFETRVPGYLLSGPEMGGSSTHHLFRLLSDGLHLDDEDTARAKEGYKRSLEELCLKRGDWPRSKINELLGISNFEDDSKRVKAAAKKKF